MRNKDNISTYSPGSMREILTLTFPILLILLSGSLMGFCDKLFLSRHSLESLEGCVDAAFLCYLFQIVLIFGARVAQVFVGECLGSKRYQEIGGYVWQMVWLSIFSMVIIIPLSRFAETLFFQNTSVREVGTVYFRCLMWFNSLFPIGAALSSFYIGRGKIKIVLLATIGANALNVGLNPLFIFGIPGFFPQMGVFGAGLATGLCQGVFCLILLIDFLSKKNKKAFGTANYQINKYILWESLRVGLPKGISKGVVVGIWIMNIHLMTVKGGNYLLAFSIGSSISLLFLFLNEAMWQGILTVASYAEGKKDKTGPERIIKSGLLSLLFFATLVAIPCLIFPKEMISLFFSSVVRPDQIDLLTRTCHWLWVFFIAHGLNGIPYFILVAKKDTLFTMFYNILFGWLFQYVPMLITFNMWGWSGDKFYLVLSFGTVVSTTVYFVRLRALNQRKPILIQTLQDG